MVPTSLFEAATLQIAVKPVCGCGNGSTFAPHGLWWHFQRRHWDDRLESARLRFCCRVCGALSGRKVRPLKLELVKPSPADSALPAPDPRAWKRATARVR